MDVENGSERVQGSESRGLGFEDQVCRNQKDRGESWEGCEQGELVGSESAYGVARVQGGAAVAVGTGQRAVGAAVGRNQALVGLTLTANRDCD